MARLIALVLILLASPVSATTGDILAQCNFEGGSGTASTAVSACNGWTWDTNINLAASIVTGGRDGNNAISYYYPNTGGEVVKSFSSPTLNKREVTVDYWEKYDVPESVSSIWNCKSIRPYVGSGGNDYMAAIMSRHNAGNWYQSTWGVYESGIGTANLSVTSAVSHVSTNSGYCTGSGVTYSCLNGRLEITPADPWGMSWKNIRVYIRAPSDNSSSDGETRVWIDGQLLYILTAINKSSLWSAGWVPYTKNITFHPSDDFFAQSGAKTDFHHFYDDITIYEGYVPPEGDIIPPITSVSVTETVPMVVTLIRNESGATYYTTDGSTPTTASDVYTTPITISTTTTIKFFSRDTAGNQESVKSATYTITPVALPSTSYGTINAAHFSGTFR